MTIQEITLYLVIPEHELRRYYQGAASDVIAIAEDGRRIRFLPRRYGLL